MSSSFADVSLTLDGVTGAAPPPAPSRSCAVDELVAGLNDAQRQAVRSDSQALLIVAGAGSGKTRVLTHRIARLIHDGSAHHGSILAITFTNKAATEMRHRLGALIGVVAERMWVSTFHSACARILRYEASRLELPSQFSIYDAADTKRMLASVSHDLRLSQKEYGPRVLSRRISALKNELIDPDDYAARGDGENPPDRNVANAYREYTARMQDAGAIDFDDIIMKTVTMFQGCPEVAEHYRRRFRHILVDEYQDTNHAQYVLIRELVGGPGATNPTADVPPGNVTVVGDSDQSIYAFRGATIRNILEFENDFPGTETVVLEQNYRSTQNILSAANAVIECNKERRPKKLWTASGDGAMIVGHLADNEYDEATFVVSEVDRLCDKHGVTPDQVAVFYRTNAQSRVLEEVLMRMGLPYRIVGGTRFYERREIKDAIAYLRVIANPNDTVNLQRIINVPKRGIGDKAQESVARLADSEGISFSAALRRTDEAPWLASRAGKAIASFVTLIDELTAQYEGEASIAELLTTILDRTGYTAALQATGDPQDESRLENLEELCNAARQFEEQRVAAAAHREAGDTDVENNDEEPATPPDDSAERPDLPGEPGHDAVNPQTEAAAATPEPDDAPTTALADFLERVSLVADADSIPDGAVADGQTPDGDGDAAITLMTLHTAKGLEFPVVFLTGLEDGVFPHSRSFSGDDVEEERRLAYVGITRARERLYLTRAAARTVFGTPEYHPPSRFLDDIPDELVQWNRKSPRGDDGWPGRRRTGTDYDNDYGAMGGPEYGGGQRRGSSGGRQRAAREEWQGDIKHWQGTAATLRRDGASSKPSATAPARAAGSRASKKPVAKVDVGDRVTHDEFGLGKVVDMEDSSRGPVAHIAFSSGDTKRIVLKFAAIEKL